MFLRRSKEPRVDPAEHKQLVEQKLAEIDAALREIGSAPSEMNAAKDESAQEGDRAPVLVRIGTSKMAEENPLLVGTLANMVNQAYGYRRIDQHDVMERLAMGDPGSSRANRVLHIAFLGDQPVGCMSSTFRVPWAEPTCGHWGLLVVDVAMQGKGIASKMVSVAEARLAGVSEQIQMEYEYEPGDALSQRLYEWYEGKCGFRCASGPPGKRGAEFRKCRKVISPEARRCGQHERLNDLRLHLAAELSALQADAGSSAGYVTSE